ncbi:MAG: ATP-binding protein [Bacteroidia bacterium]
MSKGTIEDLRKVIALSDLPDEHLQWICDRSEYEEFEDGHLLFKTGDAIDVMWFIFEGKIEFYMDVNGKLVHYFTFENNNLMGGAGGLLPYSRMKTVPGNSYASGRVKGFQIHKKYFPELEQLNPGLIQRLVGYMTERARHFATEKLNQEKVSALGQLAAGIAHELNNPASAINRISAELIKRLMLNYDLTEKLLDERINPENIKNIRQVVESKKKEEEKIKLTAAQRIEKEDEIIDWLEANGFAQNHQVAETFTETRFTLAELERIRNSTHADAFMHVILWLENLLSSQRIIKDLDEASGRISSLVGAIKSHVHMDRTNDMQPTNVHNDLENTLTLLGFKLRDKNISVKKNFCSNLRDVPAYVGELNQVWTNLIDNAIYAMSKNGELTLETNCNDKEVTVRVIDNGTGIPEKIASRIFDPFFTTKKVGDGTGIGLDIVMRIVKRHNAEIKVNSVPGRTEFAVYIPFPHTGQKSN